MMMWRAGRSLDDGVIGAGRAVVTAMLAAMVATGARGLKILGLVAAAGAAPQVVRTATGSTQCGIVRAGGAATPLQLLQLGTVVLRAAGHATDRLPGHTCRSQ